MSERVRTHFEGDGCDPPHKVTVLEPEDPDDVRARDNAGDAALSRKPTRGKRRTTERREVYE